LHEDVFRYGTAHRLQVAAEFSVKDSTPASAAPALAVLAVLGSAAAIVIEARDVK
jgi:hypothetical protein